MREYGKIFSALWRSNDFRALTEDGQKMVMYLLTSGHANLIGCYYLPYGYISEDVGWPDMGRVAAAMDDCMAHEFCVYENVSRFVFVTKWMKWNPFENPKVAISAGKTFERVPPALRYAVARAALEHCPKHLGHELTDRFEAIEPAELPVIKLATKPALATIAAPRSMPPQPDVEAPMMPAEKAAKTRAANADVKTSATWAAYTEAYLRLYPGVKPLRDAKANAQMLQFVQRVGADDAPQIAAFFVTSKWALAVNARHPVDLLLKFADKFRGEAMAGIQTNGHAAQQADRRESSTGYLARQLAEQQRADEGDEPGGVVDMEPKQ